MRKTLRAQSRPVDITDGLVRADDFAGIQPCMRWWIARRGAGSAAVSLLPGLFGTVAVDGTDWQQCIGLQFPKCGPNRCGLGGLP
jgi:hypothetical protein